ncbi:hypothetical protein PFLUV_G00127410 [Perca fluviatilis]|uniref:U1-type domain-containing protein n=1 Tax=Perca fluviatilis TaxID=8168 RepID=A0A6A5F7I4_PERFL|nr:hypothetical protein PFLUV_G00127410 [Perca fluviatilis]
MFFFMGLYAGQGDDRVEFIRPVVGYFCNLCQLIYADEDEAKLQHCRSQTHYRKYQEKTGKDPWTNTT